MLTRLSPEESGRKIFTKESGQFILAETKAMLFQDQHFPLKE